ncbi:MAG: hypothetical protein JWO99_254 [Candidatus Saccharibacteria bacterium]|nr:hypothetical protein [Candidatus Saccharibacteria bacterium]
MIEFSGLNIWAVLVAWVISVVLGSFWYSPAGFGKLWSKLSSVDMMKTPKDEATRAILFVVIASLLQALALGLVLNSLHVSGMDQGIVASLVLWFGFTALTTVGNTLYQRQSWKFWWLNASFFLIVMVINGIILSVWK